MTQDFENYESNSLERPRDKAWTNWAKLENVGDKVQGYIRDVFFRPAQGEFKEARGITLEQTNGELINVAIKRYEFVLAKTDSLRLGDPLTMVLEKLIPARVKGYSPTKQFGFYGKNLEENKGNKTVRELDLEDMKAQSAVSKAEEGDDFENQA